MAGAFVGAAFHRATLPDPAGGAVAVARGQIALAVAAALVVGSDGRPAGALMDTAVFAGKRVVAGAGTVQAGPVVAAAGLARQPVAVFAQSQAPACVDRGGAHRSRQMNSNEQQ